MINPQKENGFTPIAHEILEQLIKTDLLASELKLVLVVIRKTYGYHKKEDIISLTQFQEYTGISRPTIIKSLKSLVKMHILVNAHIPPQQISWKFNKYWDKWQLVNARLLVKQNNLTSKIKGQKLVNAPLPTIDKQKITKDKEIKLNLLRGELEEKGVIKKK